MFLCLMSRIAEINTSSKSGTLVAKKDKGEGGSSSLHTGSSEENTHKVNSIDALHSSTVKKQQIQNGTEVQADSDPSSM